MAYGEPLSKERSLFMGKKGKVGMWERQEEFGREAGA